jgi:CYTH domain-containing protein
MPFENEKKYVIDIQFDPLSLKGWDKISITQGYLNKNTRVRNYNDSYYFTYKQWLPDKNVNLEIETNIDQSDFNELWPYTSKKIYKTRYTMNYKNTAWSVDFLFTKDDELYFILAEAEMDGLESAPEIIPNALKSYIIYSVPRKNQDYTNIALSDIEHANYLYNNLINKQS